MSPLEKLRHHVTGAIERGEATTIIERTAHTEGHPHMTAYRVDFTHDDAPVNWAPTVIPFTGPNARQNAMRQARQISARKDVSTAYAIATRDGRDTGQRVYSHGFFSHQDDAF